MKTLRFLLALLILPWALLALAAADAEVSHVR